MTETKQVMERRNFIKNAALAGTVALMPASSVMENEILKSVTAYKDVKIVPVSQLKKPLAIAMWDFSWILRHHRYGEFYDWDKVLEGLAERGYNAIRMDAMPQFVVSEKEGIIVNEFRSPKKDWNPCLWGNDYTMDFRPREALLEFLPKCKKYGIQVGLATWFLPHGIDRDIFNEEEGLLRAWTETLELLQKNDLLDNVLYVDLLNEYPNNHGYDWLKQELNKRADAKKFIINNPNAHLPDNFTPGENDNRLYIKYYNNFANDLITDLKLKFPGIDFFASFDGGLENIDLKNHAALDYHIWFHHNSDFYQIVSEAGSTNVDRDLRINQKKMLDYFNKNKETLLNWMDNRITSVADKARERGIVCGNTEGWGPIGWYDHPDLSWDWVKESAEICVEMTKKHDEYKFICTSNFTHPHHSGIWDDIKWHRKITGIIRS